MDTRIILVLGILVLASGSVSLWILSRCNRSLQGVAWLGASFAAATGGAGCLLIEHVPLVSVLVADLALLGSLLLLHVAVLRLARRREVPFQFGGAVLAVQAIVDSVLMVTETGGRWRVVSISFLLALQAAVTARVLWQLARDKMRAPSLYSMALLVAFAALNLFRGAMVATGCGSRTWHHLLFVGTFTLFIGVALGLAFGFFWMATTTLTAEVEHIASTDPLTRVYNRRVFLKWCEKELLRSQRSAVPFSVLMVDLDHFKRINDNFGHQRGDEVLCAAVERMQDSVRGIDVLCRWGGEEFAVLLPNAPASATQIVAERIRENIQKLRVPLATPGKDGAKQPVLTVSIGAATLKDLDDDIPAMLLRADRALYQAKGAGRNQVLAGI